MSLISKSLIFSNKLSSSRSVIRCISTCYSKLKCVTETNQKQTYLLKPTLSSAKFVKLSYTTNQANDIKQKIDSLVKSKPVVVFMKGTAAQPMCGFSKAVVDIFNMHGVKFESHNVLADENLRSGIKEYSNWPTIPQVFFKGEFIGGCDILLEMHRSGELVDELKKIGINSNLAEDEDGNKKN